MEPWLLELLKYAAPAALSFAGAWGAMRAQVRSIESSLELLQAEVRKLPDDSFATRVEAKASAAHSRLDELERGDIRRLLDSFARLEERAKAHEASNVAALTNLTYANSELGQTVKDIKAELQDAIKDIGIKLDTLLVGGPLRAKGGS